jgi:hypothetical protein
LSFARILAGFAFFIGCQQAAKSDNSDASHIGSLVHEGAAGQYIFIEFSCEDIRKVVVTAEDQGGLNVDIDGTVSGLVSLITPQPVDAVAFDEMFRAMLDEYGYKTVTVGGVAQVIPDPARRPAVEAQAQNCKETNSNTVSFHVDHGPWDVAFAIPYTADGGRSGFRIYPGRDPKKYRSLGLRSGDTIVEMYGELVLAGEPKEGTYDRQSEFEVIDKSHEFLDALNEGLPIEVVLVRDGKRRTLAISE